MKKLIDDITNCPPVWTIRILAASILSLFSIYTAFFGVFPDMIQRSFHIGIILFLVYLMPLQNMSLEALFKSFKTYIFMILARNMKPSLNRHAVSFSNHLLLHYAHLL